MISRTKEKKKKIVLNLRKIRNPIKSNKKTGREPAKIQTERLISTIRRTVFSFVIRFDKKCSQFDCLLQFVDLYIYIIIYLQYYLVTGTSTSGVAANDWDFFSSLRLRFFSSSLNFLSFSSCKCI